MKIKYNLEINLEITITGNGYFYIQKNLLEVTKRVYSLDPITSRQNIIGCTAFTPKKYIENKSAYLNSVISCISNIKHIVTDSYVNNYLNNPEISELLCIYDYLASKLDLFKSWLLDISDKEGLKLYFIQYDLATSTDIENQLLLNRL